MNKFRRKNTLAAESQKLAAKMFESWTFIQEAACKGEDVLKLRQNHGELVSKYLSVQKKMTKFSN